jgi:hypothetical protein
LKCGSARVHIDRVSWSMAVVLCLVGCGASVCGERTHERLSADRAIGVGAHDRDQEPAGAGTGVQGMIKIPVSSKLSVAPWPRTGAPDYTFTVHSHGGPEQGSGVSVFDWTLHVDSRRALVSVESFRYDADLSAQPIGVFRSSMDDQHLGEFYKMLMDSKLFELHPSMKGHPGYTQRDYTLVEPQKGQSKQVINDSDEDTNTAIQPLPQKISEMLFATFEHPERAARLGIKQSRELLGDVFEVTVTNVGIEKIGLTDPRWVPPAGPLQQAVVMIAEAPVHIPGESEPLEWKKIHLKPIEPRPSKEPWITLEPGGIWKGITAPPWKMVPGKRYLAYFILANFAGEPMVDGVYRIRGRAESNRLVIPP